MGQKISFPSLLRHILTVHNKKIINFDQNNFPVFGHFCGFLSHSGLEETSAMSSMEVDKPEENPTEEQVGTLGEEKEQEPVEQVESEPLKPLP